MGGRALRGEEDPRVAEQDSRRTRPCSWSRIGDEVLFVEQDSRRTSGIAAARGLRGEEEPREEEPREEASFVGQDSRRTSPSSTKCRLAESGSVAWLLGKVAACTRTGRLGATAGLLCRRWSGSSATQVRRGDRDADIDACEGCGEVGEMRESAEKSEKRRTVLVSISVGLLRLVALGRICKVVNKPFPRR